MTTLVAASLAMSLACGGFEFDGGGIDLGGVDLQGISGIDLANLSANRAACAAYIETQNSLPCMTLNQQGFEQACPKTLDEAADLGPYYECMGAAVTCNGDIPDMSGLADCAKLQPL